jgi:ActR/RegA family two-component response regulator
MANAILVANRDRITLAAIRRALSRDYNVVCTQHGQDALEIAAKHELELAVIDMELSDMMGLDLVRALREHGLSCLFVTRFGHDAANLEALGLGVTYCIEEPLTAGILLSAVRRAIADEPAANEKAPERHSLQRWAGVVVPVADLPYDVRTLEEWGRAAGVSVGALRSWCRTANLPARRSLLFARMLRAVIQHKVYAVAPAELLNVVDRRTLVKMLLDSGGTLTDLPPSVQQFLEQQRIITNADALNVLCTAMVREGLLPDQSSDRASTKLVGGRQLDTGREKDNGKLCLVRRPAWQRPTLPRGSRSPAVKF